MNLRFDTKHFKELNIEELHDLLKLRSEVFVLEQDCVYLDVDGLDTTCNHILCYSDNKLIGYTRILNPKDRYPEPCISRVCVDEKFRRENIGSKLMKYSINETQKLFPNHNTIRISAQCYLEKFYNDLGFISTDKTYMEDGIPHLEMYLSDK